MSAADPSREERPADRIGLAPSRNEGAGDRERHRQGGVEGSIVNRIPGGPFDHEMQWQDAGTESHTKGAQAPRQPSQRRVRARMRGWTGLHLAIMRPAPREGEGMGSRWLGSQFPNLTGGTPSEFEAALRFARGRSGETMRSDQSG
jgi:hypothetical protein